MKVPYWITLILLCACTPRDSTNVASDSLASELDSTNAVFASSMDAGLLEFLASERRGWAPDEPGIERFKVAYEPDADQYVLNGNLVIRSVNAEGHINAAAPDVAADPLEVGECFTVVTLDDDQIMVRYWDQCARLLDSAYFHRENFEEAYGLGVAIFMSDDERAEGVSKEINFYENCEKEEYGEYNTVCVNDFPSASVLATFDAGTYSLSTSNKEPLWKPFAFGERGLIHALFFKDFKDLGLVLIQYDENTLYWVGQGHCKLYTWKEYLSNDLKGVSTDLDDNPFHKAPKDDSPIIPHQNVSRHEFSVDAVDGDWLKVSVDSRCPESAAENYFGEAWIRWRRGNALLISVNPCY